MARLLLRSTRSGQFDTRIDVVFQDVHAIKLPTRLLGLLVVVADVGEQQRITTETGMLPDEERTFFSVIGTNFTGYVVAGVVVSCEDCNDYDEPSIYWP